jgi:hypothetical protein
VAGERLDWEGPRVWPKFRVTPALPRGMRLNDKSGAIDGAPEEEALPPPRASPESITRDGPRGGPLTDLRDVAAQVDGTWELTVSNPAGSSTATVRMRAVVAPHAFAYMVDTENKLTQGSDVGELMCECQGTPVPPTPARAILRAAADASLQGATGDRLRACR